MESGKGTISLQKKHLKVLRLKWKHVYVKMCIQNLSWAPATAPLHPPSLPSLRQSQWWSIRRLCATHWLHHWSWTGSRVFQFTFLHSGLPSDSEKTRWIFRPPSRTANHCSLCSSQGKDFKFLVLWIEESLQPVRVWEICKGKFKRKF